MSYHRLIAAVRGALLGSCFALLAAQPAAASDPGYPFAEHQTFSTENRDLQTADLNGDGAPDLITYGDTDAAVRLGDGDGGFGSAVALDGLDVEALELVDLDDDDILDIATADPVSTWLGDGSGGFTPAGDSAVVGKPFGTGDFTGDDILDLVVIDQKTMTVLPGLGDGGLGAPLDVPVDVPNADGDQIDTYLQALAVGDINEDSELDLAVITYSDSIRKSGPLVEMLGDGAAGFTQVAGPGMILNGAQSLTFADLDDDGHGDLVSTDTILSQGGGSDVVFGDGAGDFARYAPEDGGWTGLFPGAVRPAVADFDGDGLLDLAAVAAHGYAPDPANSGGIYLALGTPNRDFESPIREGFDRALSGLEAADFGGSSAPDVAMIRRTNDTGRRLEIHLNEPDSEPLPGPEPTLDFAVDPAPGSVNAFIRKGLGVRAGCPPVDCSARIAIKALGHGRERLGAEIVATRNLELGETHPARVFVRPGPAMRRKLKRSGLERLRVRTVVVARFAEGEGGTMTGAANSRIGP